MNPVLNKPYKTEMPQSESKSEEQENPFNDLRQMALSVTPERLGLASSDETKVFGIVMDWDLGNGIATVVAYETGDANNRRKMKAIISIRLSFLLLIKSKLKQLS